MKVLIIPSWYPNERNKLSGSFFQEHAALLNANGFDMKVLHGRILTYGLINYLRNKILALFKSQLVLDKTFLMQDPEAFSFSILQMKYWGEKRRHQNVCRFYEAAFLKLLKTGWKPDLIHAQCTVDGGIIAAHLSNKFKVPFVIVEHQVFSLKNCSEFQRKLIVDALEQARKVGAVSNYQKKQIPINSIKCDPVVVWNFLDENKFKISPVRVNSKFRILTISYPSPIKGMDVFFKSISAFCELCSDEIEVVVIGNNSFTDLGSANTNSVEAMARKEGVYAKCIFMPYLTRGKIAYALNAADVFISTSIAETFGVAVREAMLCGVPVIATKSGGVEDSISEKTGILVNVGDYNAIAKALLMIKNKTIEFDASYIREYIVNQCGTKPFLIEMRKFYS